MIDRLWALRAKLLRFAGVSLVALVVTQSTLYICNSVLGWPGVPSNITAVCLAAIPAYLLNRRWVWGKNDRHSLSGEILPFWTYNLLGLAFSTLLVGIADATWGTSWSIQVANLVGFGVLWAGKFLLLEKVLFVDREAVSREAV